MTRAEIEAMAAANAAAVGLSISAAHKPGVITFLTLADAMARLVDGLPLGIDDEPGNVFIPISPQEAS
jgi:hypothetical protein